MTKRRLAVLVTVTVVVALLASALYFMTLPSRGYRYDDLTKVQLRGVAQLFQQVRKEQGRLPATAEGLNALISQGLIKDQGVIDIWGSRLKYQCADAGCKSATLYSLGPNKLDDHGRNDDLSIEVK